MTHVLYNPLLVFVRFIGAYYLLYFTPIFDFALRYHWSHQLMNAEFIVIGVMFYGLVIGVDAPPRPIPHIGKLGMVLAAMPFHAFFGVAVMTSKDVIAGRLLPRRSRSRGRAPSSPTRPSAAASRGARASCRS